MKLTTTGEVIALASPAKRQLIAQRWGLGMASPPLMVELLRTPRVAHRAYRRLNELGVYTLLRMMVERVGAPVRKVAALESEAEELSRWQLLLDSEDGWSLPADLALALYRPAVDEERLHLGSLLTRVPTSDLLLLLDELGLGTEGSDVTRRWNVMNALRSGRIDVLRDADAMARSAETQRIRAEEIESVRAVPGSRGGVFAIRLRGGRDLRVAPRELAEEAGHTFPEVGLEEDIQLQPAEDTLQIRVPDYRLAGAVVHFSTGRAAGDALRCEAFAAITDRRLTDTIIIVREGVTLATALGVLVDSGFSLEESMAAPRRERKVRHASE